MMAVDEGVFQRFVAVAWGTAEAVIEAAVLSAFSNGGGVSKVQLLLFYRGDVSAQVAPGDTIRVWDGLTLQQARPVEDVIYNGVDATAVRYNNSLASGLPGYERITPAPTRVDVLVGAESRLAVEFLPADYSISDLSFGGGVPNYLDQYIISHL